MAKQLTKKQVRKMQKQKLQGRAGELKMQIFKEVKSEMTQVANQHAENVLKSYLACTALTLRDELGLGKQRLERIFRKISNHCECMREGYVTESEIVQMLKEEAKFDLWDLTEKMAGERE